MKFKPADNYKDLLVQANALNNLARTYVKYNSYLNEKLQSFNEQALRANQKEIDALYATNARLTEHILELEAQIIERTSNEEPDHNDLA